MVFEADKWDALHGGESLIADFDFVLEPAALEELLGTSERLVAELHALENHLVCEPSLWRRLGLSPALLKAMGTNAPWTPEAARCLRFDFHPTAVGWKLSEVNSDVPGGLGEASFLPKFFAELRGEAWNHRLNPCEALASALATHCRSGNPAVLVADARFTEDQQVTAILGKSLSGMGVPVIYTHPEAVHWQRGHAFVRLDAGQSAPASLLYRFFQAEWLPTLTDKNWSFYLRGGATPVCNPGVAVLSESKRLPLVAKKLGIPMSMWNRYAPESHEPRSALVQPGKRLVWKRAYSNTGDHCISRAWSTWFQTFRASCAAALHPHSFVAQELFSTEKINGGVPCVGVHVINGKACGLYCRLGFQGLVNSTALDVSYSCK